MEKISYNIGKQILNYLGERYLEYTDKRDKNKNNSFINNFKEKYDLKILQKEFSNYLLCQNITLLRIYEKLELLINEKLNNNEIIEISSLKNLYKDCIFLIKSIKHYFEDKESLKSLETTQLKQIKLNDILFEFMVFKISTTIYIINLNDTVFYCKSNFNLSENNENFDKIIEQYIEDFKKKYLEKIQIFKQSFFNDNHNLINNEDYLIYQDNDLDNISSATTYFSVNQNEIKEDELIENENEYFLYYNLGNKSIIPKILKNIKNIKNDYDNNKIINKIFEYKGNIILF